MNRVLRDVLLAAAAGLAVAVMPSAMPGGSVFAAGDGAAAEETAEPIDLLFEELKHTRDKRRAQAVVAAIQRHWLESGSATVDILMRRAMALFEAKEFDDALQILDTVVEIAPDFAEGWNKRATVFFVMNQYGPAIADVRRVLAIEPRHFGALAGLGTMLKQTGRDEAALEIYRRALEINPFLEDALKSVDTLGVKVEGRDI